MYTWPKAPYKIKTEHLRGECFSAMVGILSLGLDDRVKFILRLRHQAKRRGLSTRRYDGILGLVADQLEAQVRLCRAAIRAGDEDDNVNDETAATVEHG